MVSRMSLLAESSSLSAWNARAAVVRCSGARVFLTPSHVKESLTAAIVVRSLWAAERSSWVVGELVGWVVVRLAVCWPVVDSVVVSGGMVFCLVPVSDRRPSAGRVMGCGAGSWAYPCPLGWVDWLGRNAPPAGANRSTPWGESLHHRRGGDDSQGHFCREKQGSAFCGLFGTGFAVISEVPLK